MHTIYMCVQGGMHAVFAAAAAAGAPRARSSGVRFFALSCSKPPPLTIRAVPRAWLQCVCADAMTSIIPVQEL